jgi:hypothetical protein
MQICTCFAPVGGTVSGGCWLAMDTRNAAWYSLMDSAPPGRVRLGRAHGHGWYATLPVWIIWTKHVLYPLCGRSREPPSGMNGRQEDMVG